MTLVLWLTLLAAALGACLGWAWLRWRPQGDPVVDAIEALLPQTQCAQCGYPGCRPYAQALADGAPLDRCPPGGQATQIALARLLEREPGTALTTPEPHVAFIREEDCIGCTKCIAACPVDAIVGAQNLMHTVLLDACTGCDLCLPPCPVDCIELRTPAELQAQRWGTRLPVTTLAAST